MHEARESTIIGNLGYYLNDSEEKGVYNKAAGEKNFSGNIILFKNNPFQYRKRFEKNDCCKNSSIDYQGINICKICGHIE